MKNILILLAVTSIYILPATAAENTLPTSELINSCKGELDGMLDKNFCVGLAIATFENWTMARATCSPYDVNESQVQEIFIKWVNDHSEDLRQTKFVDGHQSIDQTVMLVLAEALVDAYPCETQSNE